MSCGIGLMYTPAAPQFLRQHLSAVDYVEIPSDLFWTDRGPQAPRRFEYFESWTEELDWLEPRCALVAHNAGLSIGSAGALDEGYLAHLAAWISQYRFRWHSDHLSFSVDTAAPLPFDHEVLDLVASRAQRISSLASIPFLLENSAYYVRLPDPELDEPAFLNGLVSRDACRLLLDLHNLYANARNFKFNPFEFVNQLDMEGVTEVHVAGGSEFAGMYTDSHAGACHPKVWELLDYVVPRAPNLRGVTFEFHESYFPFLGNDGILHQLAQAREIVSRHAVAAVD
jgi:uncharacterized protein (UPF0276 family)